MTRTTVMAAALALTVTLPTVSAQAQNGTLTRSFVSSAGVDTNACTITAPCATFAVAYTKIGANGIIAALDPGKYGPITISGPVTVNGNGWAAITGPANGNGITVNANQGGRSGDVIILTGLEIDGAGTADNGIVFNSGATLEVQNCAIRNFSNDGILFQPNSSGLYQLLVSNAVVSDNGGGSAGTSGGITIAASGGGTTTGSLDHVLAENNGAAGISVTASNQTVTATISDSVSASNIKDGILAAVETGSLPVNVMVRNSTIVNNIHAAGLDAGSTLSTIRVTRSTITGNLSGWSVNNGVVLSYGDNNIDGNTNTNTEPPNPLQYH